MALFDDLTVLLKYRNDPRNAAEVSKARQQVEGTRRGFSSLTKSALGVAAGIGGVALGLGVAGRAMLSFGRESVDVFKQIQTGMSTIEGLVGISSEQLQAWVPDMQAIRRETGRTMGELTAGLYDVTSAGLRGDVAMETLRISALASAAGMGETRVVADLLTSAINAWGPEVLSAAQAGDDLAKAVELGKLPADALAGAMGQLIPIASAMGLEFGEAAGLMAAMSRTGTTAETATVQLGQVLSLLLKPGKEARDTLAAFGFQADELRDRVAEDGLLPVLQDLKDAFGEDEEAIARVFPNIRALRGVFDLLGPNLASNVAIIEDMANSNGKLGEAFNEVTDDVAFAEAQFQSAKENVMAMVGAMIAPEVTGGLQTFTGLLEKIGTALEPAVETAALRTWQAGVEDAIRSGERLEGAMQVFEGMSFAQQMAELNRVTQAAKQAQITGDEALRIRATQELARKRERGELSEPEFQVRLAEVMDEAPDLESRLGALFGVEGVSPGADQFMEIGQILDALSRMNLEGITDDLINRIVIPGTAGMAPVDRARVRDAVGATLPEQPEGEDLGAPVEGVPTATAVQGLLEAARRGAGEDEIEELTRLLQVSQPAGGVLREIGSAENLAPRLMADIAAPFIADMVRDAPEQVLGIMQEHFADNPLALALILEPVFKTIPDAEVQATLQQGGMDAEPLMQLMGREFDAPLLGRDFDADQPVAGPAEAPPQQGPVTGDELAQMLAFMRAEGYSPEEQRRVLRSQLPLLSEAERAEFEGADTGPEIAPEAMRETFVRLAPESQEVLSRDFGAGLAPPAPEPESAPETPAGTETPTTPAGADTGAGAPVLGGPTVVPTPPPEAPPDEEERVGVFSRVARGIGRLLGGGREEPAAPPAAESPAEFAEGARAFKFAPGTDETTFAAAESAPPADTGEMVMETPALQPLVVAVEGPMAPVPVNGDTTNVTEGATTTSNNTTINADIKIYGAQDPQATAVAVREELAKETQAAVRNADPGVVR